MWPTVHNSFPGFIILGISLRDILFFWNFPYLIFVADAADIVRGEFSCHVEKFQMWRHFKCGEILDVEIFFDSMSCQLWHVKSSQLITYFCCEIFFLDRIYAVLTQNLFCCNLHCFVVIPVSSRFTHFLCGEKLRPKCCPWRKNDKYHVYDNNKPNLLYLGTHPKYEMTYI